MIHFKRLGIACALVLLAGCGFGSGSPAGSALPPGGPLAVAHGAGIMPEVVSSHGIVTVELTAVMDPSDNLPTFEYEGDYDVTPTIRVNPGDTIVVDLYDGLPPFRGMADDVNLHFHGLGTSPLKPSDDVLTMLAMPGQSLHYVVKVPANQPPGLYWYHTHVHGETNYQVGEGGMSGAIVVEGIASHYPELANMPENILMVRELGMGAGDARHNDGAPDVVPDTATGGMDATPAPFAKAVRNHPCAPTPSGIITINREYQPTIRINPGQKEFFRVVNSTGHRNLDLEIRGIPMQIVAVDGYPLDTAAGEPATFTRNDWVVPPAGRVEFVATGGAATFLRTRCFFSGPYGDPDPAQLLAYLRPHVKAATTSTAFSASPPALIARTPLARSGPAAALPPPAANRLVVFSENNAGFYINGKAYSPSAPPMFVVHTGTVEQWTVENVTSEVHDFHLHQVHFLVTEIDGHPNPHPIWTDTFVVPFQRKLKNGTFKPGNISLIADFRSPIIRGTFLFHCHILDHEDQGMMAKIQAI